MLKSKKMKRLFVVLVALLFATQASAGLVPDFRFGIKAGVDYQSNSLKSSLTELDIKSNSGWFAGVQGELMWGSFGIRPELVYSHNKFDIEGADGELKLNKLDLPLLLQLQFLKVLAIHAGPTFTLMTSTNGATGGTEWSLKRPKVGYAVGAEVRVWKLAISARYNGTFKKSTVLGYATGENKISTFQIGVGFRF